MEAAKRNDAAADGLRAEQRQQEHKRAAKRAETRDVQAFGAPTPIDAPAPPPAPPAPASAPVYAPAPAAAPAATASDAAKPQLARERRYEPQEAAPAGAAATSAPKVEGDMRSKPAPLMGNATRSVAPAAAQPAQAETAQPAAANDSTSMDRVQVTGSRIMPDAAQEARLTPAQWLELIRGYRDRGDTELARDSLRRFHRAHPQTRVPDDLRALLK
jgi:Meckel syndrome type 1 protein